MSSPIGSKRNVKIFVLYLMENINNPLDRITINDIVMQTDYVMYLDFAESFNEMLDRLIEVVGKSKEGDELYAVTSRGRLVADELKSDIIDSILHQSLVAAFRYLDFKHREVKVSCRSEKEADGTYTVYFSLTEKGKVLCSSQLNVDSYRRAERIKQYMHDNPEVIYRGMHTLFTGNVDFIFK
ncbi:MAG: DUF4364 family protein [Clostridia bacterium]|nr:DUF4364 family protein [Clostridia bacterium]